MQRIIETNLGQLWECKGQVGIIERNNQINQYSNNFENWRNCRNTVITYGYSGTVSGRGRLSGRIVTPRCSWRRRLTALPMRMTFQGLGTLTLRNDPDRLGDRTLC